MALATSLAMLPVLKYVSGTGPSRLAANPLEAGIEYAIAQMNYAAQNNTLPQIGPRIVVPTSITGTIIPVTVSVTSLSSKLQNNLQSPNLTPIVNGLNVNPINTFNQGPNPASQDYRQLVATTPFSGSSISVIIGPNFAALNLPTPPPPPPSGVSGITTPLFPAAAGFGQQAVNLNGSVQTVSDGAQNFVANVASNGSLSFTGPNQINGSAWAYGSAPNSLASDGQTILGQNLNIMASIPPNQMSNMFQTDNPATYIPGGSPMNVLGDGAPLPLPPTGVFGQINSPFAPGSLPATTAPAATLASSLPAVISTSDQINFSASAPVGAPANPVLNLGAISLNGQQTLTLPPGTYTASSIDIANTASINVSTSGPVNMLIAGNPGSTSAINIGGNGIIQSGSTPSASNFQIFYNGTQSVNLTMNGPNSSFNSFYGQIYAPNATVNVNAGTTTGTVYGALASGVLNLNGVLMVHFNPATVGSAAGGSGGGGNSQQVQYPTVTIYSAPVSYSVLSWQEK